MVPGSGASVLTPGAQPCWFLSPWGHPRKELTSFTGVSLQAHHSRSQHTEGRRLAPGCALGHSRSLAVSWPCPHHRPPTSPVFPGQTGTSVSPPSVCPIPPPLRPHSEATGAAVLCYHPSTEGWLAPFLPFSTPSPVLWTAIAILSTPHAPRLFPPVCNEPFSTVHYNATKRKFW